MLQFDEKLEATMSLAENGLALANDVLEALRMTPVVRIDFSKVDRVTPSFANAMMMTILAVHPLDELRKRLVLENRNETVLRVINESVRRYQQGIRLSSQRSAIA
jgi:hypothetical protein